MDTRKHKLLTYIIKEYVKSAQAVGSSLISEKYMKDVSGPTIRNWMQELEKEGYITHKHTSAGRVPTEKGYRYYLKNLEEKKVSNKQQKDLVEANSGLEESAEKVKIIAKKIAELSGGAVIIAFSPQDVYYTGLSNLFSHPEFDNQNDVINMSQMIDHLDEVMSEMESSTKGEVSVLIGSDNPFGEECGTVLSVLDDGLVIGILGPMRMDYSQNVGLVRYIKYLLEE